MLQPRTYPELVGKALFLEPDPFLVMAHDDEPLAEGATLVALLGLVVGAAQVTGNWLQAWLTSPVSLDPFVMQGAPQADASMALWMADPLRAMMLMWHNLTGLESGWGQTLPVLAAPIVLLIAWLVIGLLLWMIGRMAGGTGSPTEVLGATALVMVPALFYLLHIVPFTYINFLLPLSWALLLYYRAAQISLDLTWQRALGVTVISVLVLFIAWVLLGAGTLLLASL